uniref:Uncharacterized protein n=1 Tax=Oryza brachyantha TaxID=4533 RepID=J3LTF0_ORYBR
MSRQHKPEVTLTSLSIQALQVPWLHPPPPPLHCNDAADKACNPEEQRKGESNGVKAWSKECQE